MPDRIRLRRTPGWKPPDEAVSVARPSRFGNPFKIGGKFMTPGFYGAKAAPYYGALPPGEWVRGGGMDPMTIRMVQSREHAVALFIDWIKHEPAWKVEYLAPNSPAGISAAGARCPNLGAGHLPRRRPDRPGERRPVLTPEWADENGVTHVTVKRCCNGCGTLLGDATEGKIATAVDSLLLHDVRPECRTCSPASSSKTTDAHRRDCSLGDNHVTSGRKPGRVRNKPVLSRCEYSAPQMASQSAAGRP
jgi:hypothetical protein